MGSRLTSPLIKPFAMKKIVVGLIGLCYQPKRFEITRCSHLIAIWVVVFIATSLLTRLSPTGRCYDDVIVPVLQRPPTGKLSGPHGLIQHPVVFCQGKIPEKIV